MQRRIVNSATRQKRWKSLSTILVKIGVGAKNKQFAKDLERQCQIMQIEEREAKTNHTWSMIHHYYTNLLQLIQGRGGSLEKSLKTNANWAILQQIGASSISGIRYFHSSVCLQTLPKRMYQSCKIEEITMVSEERVKLAGFAKGVVEHVISMDSGCRFDPVPEGVKILMNTWKVLRVKFVQPHAQCVLDLEAVRAKAQKLVEEEKQEMLKWIAIETGKQKCTKDKIEKDNRRKEINSMPMKRSFLEDIGK